MAKSDPLISVVIPCKDEAEGLPALAAAVAAWDAFPRRELLFVDDGSVDRTAALIAELFPQARLLAHPRNLGIGAALRTGSLAATGDLVAWFDADASYDPALLPEMAALLLASGAAAVTVSPWSPGGGAEGLSASRSLPSTLVSRLYGLLAPGRLHTYTAMVRVHRREALLPALPRRDGFPGVTESLLRILLQGGRVLEQPALLRRRTAGRSKMRLLAVTAGHLSLLAALLLGRLGPRAPAGRPSGEGSRP